MTAPGDPATSREMRARRTILTFCAFAAVLTTALAVSLFSSITAQVRALDEVQTDNRTWSLAQVEVELLRLRSAVQEARAQVTDPASSAAGDALADLRLRFDIVYSRHTTLTAALGHGELGALPEIAAMLAAQEGFLSQTLGLIDGPDAALIAALDRLDRDVAALHGQTRQGILAGLAELVGESSAARQVLQTRFRQFGAAVFVLTLLMALMIGVALRQTVINARRLAATQRMRDTLDLMIQASLDAVLIVDAGGFITLHNRAASAILAPEGRRLQGVRLSALLDRQGLAPPDLAAMDGKGRLDIRASSLAGRVFPAEIVVTRTGHEATDFIVFLRDMSDVVDRERRLTAASIAARQGEEAKARFLAVMSHEMRTPLNGVLATLDLLRPLCTGDARAESYLAVIERSGQAALDQVNNVLELARMGASDGTTYPEVEFSPAQVLADLAGQMGPSAQAAGNRLEVVIDPAAAALRVRGRLTLFTRSVSNLLANAVKFTSNGAITLGLALRAAPPGQTGLAVSVSDTGIGIAAQDIDRIFRTFETLDASYARMRDGSGLGLGIAKLAAESLGGAIHVDSAPGRGSTFTLTAVFAGAAEAPVPTALAESGPGAPLRLLVAEDNPINADILMQMLVADGHHVDLARDGHEAVRRGIEGGHDLILMDISMPGCDGLEATRRLRAAGVVAPVVAVTAMAGADQIAGFREAGLSDVMTKPISRARLRALLGAQARPGATAPDDLVAALGPEAAARFRRQFLDELNATRAALRDLAARDARDDIAALAHRTAGAAAVVGFGATQSLLQEIRAAAAAGADLAPLLARLDGHEAALSAPPDDTPARRRSP